MASFTFLCSLLGSFISCHALVIKLENTSSVPSNVSKASANEVLDTICDPLTDDHRQHDSVIVMLVPGRKLLPYDWNEALRALASLHNINDAGRTEVRIFHDEADHFTDKDLQELMLSARPRKTCATRIRLAQFPPGITEDSKSPWRKRTNWGYLHMIRFMFVDILDPSLGLLNGFKYWIRLDTDSVISSPVPDPISYFDRDPKLGYLASFGFEDCGKMTQDLPEFTRSLAKRLGVPTPVAVEAAHPGCVQGFYNNIEVGRISSFQTAQAQQITREVVASKGIYNHRWGDAILRRLVIEMTGIPQIPIPGEVWKGYEHRGHPAEPGLGGFFESEGHDLNYSETALLWNANATQAPIVHMQK